MTKEQLAELLNGRQYRNEITKELCQLAKENGLVVVYGASDDLMEFEGAIYDELSAWDGTTAYLVKKKGGWEPVPQEDYESYLQVLDDYGIADQTEKHEIHAEWSPEDPECSWLITTEIPNATFDILEDGELYCRGIVFSLGDI